MSFISSRIVGLLSGRYSTVDEFSLHFLLGSEKWPFRIKMALHTPDLPLIFSPSPYPSMLHKPHNASSPLPPFWPQDKPCTSHTLFRTSPTSRPSCTLASDPRPRVASSHNRCRTAAGAYPRPSPTAPCGSYPQTCPGGAAARRRGRRRC